MSSDLNNIFDHLFDDMNNEKEKISENKKEFIEENQEKLSDISDNRDVLIDNSIPKRISIEEPDDEYDFISAEYKSDIQSKSIRTSIAAAVIRKREDLGYDRKQFGKYIGIKSKNIFKIENTEYDFSIDELIELCNKLNINLEINIFI